MKLLFCLVFLTIWCVTKSFDTPKTTNLNQNKFCKNCKYFRGDNLFDLEYSIKNGKCTKFGDLNVLDGKIIYENAKNIRADESKCCIDGTLFENDKYSMIKLYKIQFDKYFPFVFAFFILALNIVELQIKINK